MNAMLLIDGLPPSNKVGVFIETVGSDYDVFYCSFVEVLSDFNHQSILSLLDAALKTITKDYSSVAIVGVSFGAYVVAHSHEVMSKYADHIDKIVLYSPVAQLRWVRGIDTLPRFLNSRYSHSSLEPGNFLELDNYFNKENLLAGSLLSKTRMVLGGNDPQLPIDIHKEYFSHFAPVVSDEAHIGIGNLISRKDPEWK